MLWLLETQPTLSRQLLIHASQSWERMRYSMLFSTCFKAVRRFLHNQLSSRTHTTGLNLFFSATTIPRWWSAILIFETFFFLQPLKGRCNNFQGGIYDSQPLPERTFTYSVLLSFCRLSKLIGQRKLAWKPTIGAFHAFCSKSSTTIS